MGAPIANVAVGLAIALTVIAFLLFAVGAMAYARTRAARLAWVSLGMLGLALQGIRHMRYALDYRSEIAAGLEPFPPMLLLDSFVVAALYMAVLKR